MTCWKQPPRQACSTYPHRPHPMVMLVALPPRFLVLLCLSVFGRQTWLMPCSEQLLHSLWLHLLLPHLKPCRFHGYGNVCAWNGYTGPVFFWCYVGFPPPSITRRCRPDTSGTAWRFLMDTWSRSPSPWSLMASAEGRRNKRLREDRK